MTLMQAHRAGVWHRLGAALALVALHSCNAAMPLNAPPDALQPSASGYDAGVPPETPVPWNFGDPYWGCLDNPEVTTRTLSSSTEPGLTLNVTSAVSGSAPEGLTARACGRLDVACSTPGPAAAVDADGAIHLPVERGFDGFVELTSATTAPTLYFVNEPLSGNRQASLLLFQPSVYQTLASGNNVQFNPQAGALNVRAVDCYGDAADGVLISNDRGGEAVALYRGLPVPGVSVTSDLGFAMFVNVPSGSAVVQGRIETGRGSGRASVSVRSGWFTYVDIMPWRQ